jgi:hypothetical protein
MDIMILNPTLLELIIKYLTFNSMLALNSNSIKFNEKIDINSINLNEVTK